MSLRPDLLSLARQVTTKSHGDALHTESGPTLSTKQDKALAAAARGRVMHVISKPGKKGQNVQSSKSRQPGQPPPPRRPPSPRASGPAPLSVSPELPSEVTTLAFQDLTGDSALPDSSTASRSQSQTPSLSQSSQRQRTRLSDDLTSEDLHLRLLVEATRSSRTRTEPTRSQAPLLFVSDGTRLASYSQQYSHSPMDALTVSQEDSQPPASTTKLGVMDTVDVASSAAK